MLVIIRNHYKQQENILYNTNKERVIFEGNINEVYGYCQALQDYGICDEDINTMSIGEKDKRFGLLGFEK